MSGEARSDAEKLRVLLAWFEENHVTYNEEAIEVVLQQKVRKRNNIVSDGLGIIARRNLIDEEPLVVIPKRAAISSATSALANVFEDEELAGSLALTIAVMYEMAQGTESPWYGYLQSLPRCADIPLLWDTGSRKWLAGTDVGRWAEADEKSLRDDFAAMQRLVADYPAVFESRNGVVWDDFTRFLEVASLVSSRAFMVDEYRGNSMVPFADIFNHLSAGPNVHIESEEEVCLMCGKELGCEHTEELEEDAVGDDGMDCDEEAGECSSHGGHSDDDDEGSDGWDDEESGDGDEEEEEEDSSGEEIPLLVDGNGDTPVEAIQEQPLRKNDAEQSEDEDDLEYLMDGTLDMVVFEPCKAHSEVFNTYGDHGSAYLLHRYGFCDTDNPFDSVLLSKSDVMQAISVAVSEKRAAEAEAITERFRSSFNLQHRAKIEDTDEDTDEDGSGHEDTDEEEDTEEEEEDAGDSQDTASLSFSIDAPGHPDLNLATLLVLALAEEAVFEQVSQSADIFGHFFPIIGAFWLAFQDKLDTGASVATAFRVANKDGAVKESTIGAVCRVVQQLAEKRLAQLGNDRVLGKKPSDPLQCIRWTSAKQLRENESLALQQCIKRYRKAATKLQDR
ncbi:hypothetical protein GGF46_003057 [Coemansia sp. RSA 552]|nr:hypothetical protein GGF46_003057 [Coemansia sp. RSA 552]